MAQWCAVVWAKVCALGALCARIGEQKCAKAGAKVRSGEGALYRNGSEAREDEGGFVDKLSSSVEEMERLCGGNGAALWRKWEQFGVGCTWFCRGNGVVRA